VTVQPKDRKSINLSLLPDPSGQLLQSVQLVFSDAEISFTPLLGIISVIPTASGATVTATEKGSAQITLVFAGDTTGLNDAIIGIAVF